MVIWGIVIHPRKHAMRKISSGGILWRTNLAKCLA